MKAVSIAFFSICLTVAVCFAAFAQPQLLRPVPPGAGNTPATAEFNATMNDLVVTSFQLQGHNMDWQYNNPSCGQNCARIPFTATVRNLAQPSPATRPTGRFKLEVIAEGFPLFTPAEYWIEDLGPGQEITVQGEIITTDAAIAHMVTFVAIADSCEGERNTGPNNSCRVPESRDYNNRSNPVTADVSW